MDTDGCAIDGNGDLYGLGVRIGVYCQWVSSWIRMLVDEESIEDVHGVNAIFVFAVIIATILAQVHRDVKPIELYIMLQISLGFFITVLSTIGVRNHFLRPKRVKLIWHHYQKVVEKRRQNAELGEKIWSRHRFKQIFKEEQERNNVVKAFYQSLFRMGREYLEDAAAKQYLSNPTFEVPVDIGGGFPSHSSKLLCPTRRGLLGHSEVDQSYQKSPIKTPPVFGASGILLEGWGVHS
ncbi:hypothetical protein COL922a_009119 [Colletotrichum nupharicola]|nr:hypothetical protein COL922a_009119 [Colletotrichum nupharicola]